MLNWVTWRLGAQISFRETKNLLEGLSVPPSPYASVAQSGTAQAWNFTSGNEDSLFPSGYPGSNPGAGVRTQV